MMEDVRSLVAKHEKRILDLRCEIHRNPELSGQELKTAALAASVLQEMGLKVRTGVGGNGVVAILEGEGRGPCIALRGDMDALPLEEETGHPCSSMARGVMHACGHDAHTAILLGTAFVLSELRRDLAGTVKFLFQPAEEANPQGGAPGMIAEGVLRDPEVDAVFGLHVWPSLKTGTAATRCGTLMGASDRVFLTISGRGAHGAEPENSVDAIAIAGQVITALQTIVSRNTSPLDSVVISLGTIRGGKRYNVIADEVVLEGTVRTVDPGTRSGMPARIETVACGIARAMGGECRMEYVRGYPPVVNHAELVKKTLPAIAGILGGENVLLLEKPALVAEDFSFFGAEVPSMFLWLGCRPEEMPREEMPPLHSSRFLPDVKAIPLGVEILASCALANLGRCRGRGGEKPCRK